MNCTIRLSALLLLRVCLRVLKRKSASPLIRTRLAADPAITASKQDTPQRNGTEEAASDGAECEREIADFGPHSIAIEGEGGVEEGGDCECWESVGSLGISC